MTKEEDMATTMDQFSKMQVDDKSTSEIMSTTMDQFCQMQIDNKSASIMSTTMDQFCQMQIDDKLASDSSSSSTGTDAGFEFIPQIDDTEEGESSRISRLVNDVNRRVSP